MNEAARAYIAVLGTRIGALTRARAELAAGTPGAEASVRRLVRMVRSAATTAGFPLAAEAAATVETAAREALDEHLGSLIAAMTAMAATDTGGGEPAVILVVEDDAVVQALVRRTLESQNRRIIIADSMAAAEEMFRNERVSLVVLDLVLPDGDGRNFLVRIREDPRTAAIPIVIVSALDSAAVRSECYALGCDAYVAKPIDLEVLGAAAMSLLERSARRLREARVDALTGLPNRAAIRDALTRHDAASAPGAVAMIDLDAFKQVNERLGTEGGDTILRAFGAFVRAALRPSDVLGRWGGEEFVVLLPGTSVPSASAALTEIGSRLAKHPLVAGTEAVHVSFTCGVAALGGGTSGTDAVAEAERLLFFGKAGARGTVVITAESAAAGTRTVLLAEDDPVIAALVRHRLERDGFDLVHASNGTDAFERAGKGRLALAILDVNMPGIGGFELLERMRALPATARVPIMMLTSMGNEADIARALALGANDYMLKPFSPVELLARVRRLVAHA